MILLDTNICIYIINARPAQVLARFHAYRLGDIGLCSVVAAELAYGVAKSGSARNREALEMFLAPLEILPFDANAVWAYGELRADRRKRNRVRPPAAAGHRCRSATRNRPQRQPAPPPLRSVGQ